MSFNIPVTLGLPISCLATVGAQSQGLLRTSLAMALGCAGSVYAVQALT